MAKKYAEEDVISQVGGRFKLATLLEKRYRELLFGGRPLVKVESNDPLDTLLQEVVEKKIELIPEAEAIAAAAAVLMSEANTEARDEQAVRAALALREKKEDEDEKKKVAQAAAPDKTDDEDGE